MDIKKQGTARLEITVNENSLMSNDARLLISKEEHFKGIETNDDKDDDLLIFRFENQNVPTLVSCKTDKKHDCLLIKEGENGDLELEKIGIIFPSVFSGYFLNAFQCKYLVVGPENHFDRLKSYQPSELLIDIN